MARVRGLLSFIGCSGFSSQDIAAWINCFNFDGDVIIDKCRWWYPGANRTQPDVFCDSTKTDVYIDPIGPGPGFFNTPAGVIGGVLHFDRRQILSVLGLAPGGVGQSFPASTPTPARFQNVDLANGLARWSAGYSAATGIYTIPAGGLKNIEIHASALVSGVTGANFIVRLNGADYSYGYFNIAGQVLAYFPSLSAGETLQIVLAPFSGAGSASTTNALNRLSITASN